MPVSLKDQVVLVVARPAGLAARPLSCLRVRTLPRVNASARREERLRELQTQLQKEGHPIEVLLADASKVADMTKLAEFTRSKFGRIDVMVL